MEYSGRRILFSLNILADKFLAQFPEMQRVLDGAGGCGERLGRAQFVILHHTVTTANTQVGSLLPCYCFIILSLVALLTVNEIGEED